MTYRIGFFLNLPQHLRHRENCIVVFNGNDYEFKTIPKRFFYDAYPRIPEYHIKEPVLYSENDKGETLDACFIKDIPLRAAGELTNKGLELYVPFFSYGQSLNPCIGEHLTTGMFKREPVDSTILKDGKDLFPLPDFNSFEWGKRLDVQLQPHIQMIFAHYVLCYTFLRKVAGTIHDECLSLGLFTSCLDEPWNNFYLQQIDKLESYLNNINIKSITKDLTIRIDESFYKKIGHDEEYSIIKTTKIRDNAASQDVYLNHLLQLGEKETYHARGYCSAESMALKDILTGDLPEEQLEQERIKIEKKYSKRTHMAYLLSEAFSRIIINQYHAPNWDAGLKEFYDVLMNDFHLKELNHFIANSHDIIREKSWKYDDDLTMIVKDLNTMICDKITCSLTIKKASKLQKMYLGNYDAPSFKNQYNI